MFSSLRAYLRSGSARLRVPTRRPAQIALSVDRLDERSLLSGGLVAAPLEAPAALIQRAAAPANHQVAFHLSGTGQLDFATGNFSASGEATQLGHWTNSGHLDLVPVVVNEKPRFHATGQATSIAANGDALSMSIDGFADPATGHATATFTVTGGTGRFQNATGTEHMELDQNFTTGAFIFTLDGTISAASASHTGAGEDLIAAVARGSDGLHRGQLKRTAW
jgi:hypothetical protein